MSLADQKSLLADASAKRSHFINNPPPKKKKKQTGAKGGKQQDKRMAQFSVITCLFDKFNLASLHNFMSDRRCNFSFFIIYHYGGLRDVFANDKNACEALRRLGFICSQYSRHLQTI